MKKETFTKIVKQVMEHNEYESKDLTTYECNKKNRWTPCDLIAREYLNNGGGSAKGFLGIGTQQCINAFKYMCEHKNELINNDMINKNANNNWGFPLWRDYDFDR